MIQAGRKFAKSTRGAAAIEAAIVTPVLALIGFGAIDGANLYIQTHALEAGLTAGGSYLAQSAGTAADIKAARNIAVSGQATDGGVPRIAGLLASDVQISLSITDNSAGRFRGQSDVRVAQLSASLPYRGIGFMTGVTGGNLSVDATYEARMIR